MFPVTKIRLRRLYKLTVYGLALYGLTQLPLCSKELPGAQIQDMNKSTTITRQYVVNNKSGLEKIIKAYKNEPIKLVRN